MFAAFGFSMMSVFIRLAGDVPTAEKAFFRNIVALAHGGRAAGGEAGAAEAGKGQLAVPLPAGRCSAPSVCC